MNLIAYLYLRASSYKRDKCGLTWELMRSKCLLFVVDLPDQETYKDFTASNSYIKQAIKDHRKIGIKLHGEASGMSDEYRKEIMSKWRPKFHQVLLENKITKDFYYNAD